MMMSNAMLRTVENEMKKYLVSSPRIIFFDRIEDTIITLIESVLSKFDATYEEQIYSADSCLYLRPQLRVRKKVIIQLTKVIGKLHLSNMSDPSIKHMINGDLKGLRQDIIKNAIFHGVSCISEQPDATTPVEPSRQLAPCRPLDLTTRQEKLHLLEMLLESIQARLATL